MSSADALIHLRLSAARKGCWVRASRSAGLRLTDWIINIVEDEMKIIDKVAAYSRIHRATEGLDFGKQNLILSEAADSMHLTHRFGDGVYSLYRRRPYSTEPMGKSLIDLPMP